MTSESLLRTHLTLSDIYYQCQIFFIMWKKSIKPRNQGAVAWKSQVASRKSQVESV